MTCIKREDWEALADELSISPRLARDLLFTAGGDRSIVKTASKEGSDIGEVKARIIDMRLSKIERKDDQDERQDSLMYIPQAMRGIVTE